MINAGCQSDPITRFHLFEEWARLKQDLGEIPAIKFAKNEFSSAKRLNQIEMLRGDIFRRLKRHGFSEAQDEENRAVDDENADFGVEAAYGCDRTEEGGVGGDQDGAEEARQAQAVGVRPGAEISLPAEYLLKSVLLAAFAPNLAISQRARPAPPTLPDVQWADPSRTVYFKLAFSDTAAEPNASATETRQIPDFVASPGHWLPVFGRCLSICCDQPVEADGGGGDGIALGGGLGVQLVQPKMGLSRGRNGEQYLIAEFPTDLAALLAVRMVGLRRQYPVLSNRGDADGAGVPLLTDAAFAPRLGFARLSHKTEKDLAEGTCRGHSLDLHWHSCAALLHDGQLTRMPSENVPNRYLLSTGYLRPGVSRNRLLALHPTMLPTAPMVAELMLVAFSREVSWLVGTRPHTNPSRPC